MELVRFLFSVECNGTRKQGSYPFIYKVLKWFSKVLFKKKPFRGFFLTNYIKSVEDKKTKENKENIHFVFKGSLPFFIKTI